MVAYEEQLVYDLRDSSEYHSEVPFVLNESKDLYWNLQELVEYLTENAYNRGFDVGYSMCSDC